MFFRGKGRKAGRSVFAGIQTRERGQVEGETGCNKKEKNGDMFYHIFVRRMGN